MILVDSSALYAGLDADDPAHVRSADTFAALIARGERLVVHSFGIVETIALLQRRIGPSAVRTLVEDVLPRVETFWVQPPIHERAVLALLSSASRRISIVDWTSFEVMRELGIRTAFAFDDDFRAQGFEVLPS